MYTLLENRQAIAKAQRTLERTLHHTFNEKGTYNIGYPGGTSFDNKVHCYQQYWYHAADHKSEEVKNPRRLNWFGMLSSGSSLNISVEINVAYEGRNDRVAGFFARHEETGQIYLFHSGRVGGGTEGVGRDALLAWSNLELHAVNDAEGKVREGVLVMPVDGEYAIRPLLRFVDTIANFKQAVRDGELQSDSYLEGLQTLQDYFKETSGQRKRRQIDSLRYETRHGDVVDALQQWRQQQGLASNQRIIKNVLMDLGVSNDHHLQEVYEVKTGTARQDLYTAIGQLMVHAKEQGCSKTLVLPDDTPEVPDDIAAALARNDISLLYYSMDDESVTIL